MVRNLGDLKVSGGSRDLSRSPVLEWMRQGPSGGQKVLSSSAWVFFFTKSYIDMNVTFTPFKQIET